MIDQKIALVTGGSRGIGRAISTELARDGYAVMINYHVDVGQAEKTREAIEKAGGTAEICQADVSAPSHRDLLVNFTLEHYGRIDLLVNNAAVASEPGVDLLENDVETFNQILATNLAGPFFLSQRVAKLMIAVPDDQRSSPPTIVNISSFRAYTTMWNHSNYCISKAGLSMITKLFAHRLAQYGIRVYEIRPGIIETDLTARQEIRESYGQRVGKGLTPINRWGKPEEVGRAVAMIARGELPFSTGEIINVDGGWHLRSL